MFDTETFAAIISLPGEMEIEPAALLAVAEVESGGRALFDINGKKYRLSASKGIILTAGFQAVFAIRLIKQGYQLMRRCAFAIPRQSGSAQRR